LEAELEIVERFNHSMKVGYADYAFDATLAGDYKDLKFKNNTGYPLYIEGYCTSSNVVVKIYGYEVHDSGRKIVFKNKYIKSTEPDEPKITYDDTKPEGYEEYTQTALQGQTYELYKYVYENGELVDTVKINTSTYSPRRAEITKGTKKPEVVTEQVSDTASTPQDNTDNVPSTDTGNAE
jgi:vancomycin resistance protein YoaR